MGQLLASASDPLQSLSELSRTTESGHMSVMLALAVTGFVADPDLVTATLGFEPTSVGRKGELMPSGRPRTFNGWWHDAHDQHLVDGRQHYDALARLLARLRGREGHFARLRTTIQPQQVMIYGGLYMSVDGQCGVWLEPDQMQLLAACGIGWSLDLFVDD